ncbi:MAG TPA: sulfatase-like hydrolase/transferase, partial [Thermoanaerobaculia bacterium]
MRFRERRTRRLAVLCLALLAGLGAVRLHAQTGGPPKNETKNEIKAVPWGDFDYRKAANQNRYLVEIPATGTKGGNSPLAVKPAPNMEPVMLHPVQIQEAVDNLQNRGYCAATLARSCPTCKIDPAKEKGCKHPNILIFLTDDMGWSDYGAYGGGATFGAVTPNIDRLAHEGLMLTSTYAQPSCSPTRA